MDTLLTCIDCGKEQLLPVSKVQYLVWKKDPYRIPVQRMFPALSDDERELLISGICGVCYDKLFPELD